MKKSIIFFYFSVFTTTFFAFGQELQSPQLDYNNIGLPPTPTGASLGEYEDIPVDMATGVPGISIPIFTLNIDDVSIPISLSYHASGVQVNELPTAVGLNWTLNAGGGIFRNVNSLPDEDGWITSYGPLPDSFYEGVNIFDNNYRVSMLGHPLDGGGLASTRDHNPDDYNYNFLGNSGKFIIDFGNEAIKNQADQLDIDFDFSTPTIIDQVGNNFSFGVFQEHSFRRYGIASIIHRNPLESVGPSSFDYGNVTGWMLSKITTKNNNEIFFEYESRDVKEHYVGQGNRSIVSNTLSLGYPCAFDQDPEIASIFTQTFAFETQPYLSGYTVQLIKKISSPQAEVSFHYSDDESLSTWKRKLDKIIIKDKLEMTTKEFHFAYDVFNGDSRLKLERVYEKKGNEELPGYRFSYETGDLPERYSSKQDFFGYYNGPNGNNSLVPYDEDIEEQFTNYGNNLGGFYELHTRDRTYNTSFLQTGILEEIFYPTGGSSKFYYEPNAEFVPELNIIKYCGGLRVKKIENKDQGGSVVKTKEYQYNGLEGQSYETHKHLTKTIEEPFQYGGNTTYHSGFVKDKSINLSGYFYKEVTEMEMGEGETHKNQKKFIENFSYGTLGHLLESEALFKGNDTIKIIEYDYGGFGNSRTIHWNILGDRVCGVENGSDTRVVSTYKIGNHVQASGDMVMLPNRIATTDFFNPLGTPVTVIKTMGYDNETLLKISETVDTRYSRVGEHEYNITNTIGEKITTNYFYPSTPEVVDLPYELPKGLLLRKEVFSETAGSQMIFGQAMEYDNFGNIKNTYRFNKGGGAHSGGPVYVPQNYELDVSYLTDEGKPTQIRGQNGVTTSYIWGYNKTYPVAKIIGLSRVQAMTTPGLSLVTINEPNSDEDLSNEINKIRLHFPKAEVTTYTYKPLIGISTITDPKGYMITYVYDDFGRLKYVKDMEGNVLSENQYHYKND